MLQLMPLFVTLFVTVVSASQAPPTSDTRVVIESDGWQLVGNVRRPNPAVARPAAVLLLHGAARDRRAYGPLATELAARGIASLRLDLRGEGESTNLGRFEPGVTNQALDGSEHDVAAALRWLRRQPGLEGARIGVLGASYTGEAMAVAARTGAAADAYVALSPGSFSDESAQAIDAAGRPWWFLASADERFAVLVVRRIPDLSRTARVTIVDGTSHASDILSPHVMLNAEIADWFAATLGRLTTPPFWGELTSGGWPVGYARTAAGSTVVDIWYPADRACATPVTFGDYFRRSPDLRGVVEGFPDAPGALDRSLSVAISGQEAGLGADMATRILASPMAACLDASPASGSFPLVLWTPRYATTSAQAVLSEFLASHGFVVAFGRPATVPVPMPFEMTDPAARRAELAARVGDMARTRDYLLARPGVDGTRIGVIAWSYTGEMATAFDRMEPRTALVIGLSSNTLAGWVYDRGADASLDPASLHAVHAVFRQSAGEPAPQPQVLSRLPMGYFIDMPGMSHGAFNALEGFIPSLLGITTVQPFSSSDERARTGYQAMAIMTLRLLRHHLPAAPAQPIRRLALTSGLPEGLVRR